jgi:hypothetical protein
MFASLRVTRSVKRRRNESFQPGPASRSQKLFSPLCAPPLRRDVPRASFQLTDLPSEIGILIADRLDTASRASMVLVNRTTASWISKSLLARVNACQLNDDAEALERDDSPQTVARFVSAVASVCIPREERTKFVAGIVQLHSRPDARVPTLGVADECGVLRSVVGKWSPERQGEVLAQYLQTELETLKPISHFLRRPGDSGALNQATDERIFRVLNHVMVLDDKPERARRAETFEGEDASSLTDGDARRFRLLARAVRAMTRAAKDKDGTLLKDKSPETLATLVHLMLGPNEFYVRLLTGETTDPAAPASGGADGGAEPFFVTFDLDDDTAGDYAEDRAWKDIEDHYEAFDTSLDAFAGLFTHMLACDREDHRADRGEDETFELLDNVTTCWSFEFKLALAAFAARRAGKRAPAFVRRVLMDPAFAKHCAPALASASLELPTALFRVLGRDAFSAEDFARFFNLLAADWTAGARRAVLGKVTRGLVRGEMLVPGCECGCQPPRIKDTLFDKLAALATLGVTHGLAEETRLLSTATPRASPSRENDPFSDGFRSPAPVQTKRARLVGSPFGSLFAATHTPTQEAHTPQPGTPFAGIEE